VFAGGDLRSFSGFPFSPASQASAPSQPAANGAELRLPPYPVKAQIYTAS
jgi:hypothetical protein